MQKDLKTSFIPVNVPVVSKEAIAYAKECLETGWLSSAGPYVPKFEQAFAEYLGLKHGVAVSSGTAALHCSLLALGIKKGDEVIVPAFTMMATIFAVMYTGAKPIFVDCDLDNFNIDPEKIEEKISSKTKAIIPVHIFGHACEMDTITAIANKHNLKIIEDAAQAHGGRYKGNLCGSMGDLSCFSFYANKIIAAGEGGLVVTNDDVLAKRLRRFRDLCHSEEKRFIHDDIGYNFRITNVQAAIGLGELQNIDTYIQQKIEMANLYNQELKKYPGIRLPITKPLINNVFWMYGILIDKDYFGIDKDQFRTKLRERGVDTRDFFYPPQMQPVLSHLIDSNATFPNATYVTENGCYLPSGLALSKEEIKRVCQIIGELKETG